MLFPESPVNERQLGPGSLELKCTEFEGYLKMWLPVNVNLCMKSVMCRIILKRSLESGSQSRFSFVYQCG